LINFALTYIVFGIYYRVQFETNESEVTFMITGTTKNLGVIGWPIVHSLSPAMQNAAIASAGLDAVYIAMPVAPEALKDAVRGLRASGFVGWNVTIPHKTAIMEFLDEIDEDARAIGAVNTVVSKDGKLKGYNTDILGFCDGLHEKNVSVKGKSAVVLGAGGAARAILRGLIKEEVSDITIAVRSPEKALPLAKEIEEYIPCHVVEWTSKEMNEALSSAALVVNTTPLGMAPKTDDMPPLDWDALAPSAFVYDIIYTPGETKLLREARLHGHDTQNGVPMLVGQGAAALSMWLDVSPDRNAMRSALENALSKKA
jgi:shikimate dehydrogenase